MLCIETNTSLGSLQKFEGAAGEFLGALSCWHPLISSPRFTIFWVKTFKGRNTEKGAISNIIIN